VRENGDTGHPHRDAASVERPDSRRPSIVARPQATDKNAAPAAAREAAPELDQQFLLGFFKALFDPTRLRIAAAVAAQPMMVSALAAELGLSPADVAKHLTRLEAAGVAVQDRDRWAFDAEGLRSRARRALPTPRSDTLGGAKDERAKVLAAFMRDGRLLTFPTGDARKLIVLGEIVRRFDTGRVYSEHEVNDALKAIYADYATLRCAAR
jgi:hypothetical protein